MTMLQQMLRSGSSDATNIDLPGADTNDDASNKNPQSPQPTSDALMSAVLKELKIMTVANNFLVQDIIIETARAN